MTTEIASAVDSVAAGRLQLCSPSAVTPAQLPEDGDDTADLVDALGHGGQVEGPADLVDTPRDDVDLGVALSGRGSTTVLKRRRRALDSSSTPRSRSLAVAITLKPRTAILLAEFRYGQGPFPTGS